MLIFMRDGHRIDAITSMFVRLFLPKLRKWVPMESYLSSRKSIWAIHLRIIGFSNAQFYIRSTSDLMMCLNIPAFMLLVMVHLSDSNILVPWLAKRAGSGTVLKCVFPITVSIIKQNIVFNINKSNIFNHLNSLER